MASRWIVSDGFACFLLPTSSCVGQRLAKLFYGMIQEFGRKKTITFMRKVGCTGVKP